MNQPPAQPSAHRGNFLLIALAAAVVLGVYVLGKVTPRLSFQPVGADWFGEWLVWLFAAALFALMLLGPARSRTTPRRRMALISLRLAVIVLVILMMLRPVLVYWASSQRPAVVPVLVDVTGSMKAPDVDGSRFARMKKTLADAAGPLADLSKDLEIKFYAFDSDLRELKFSGGKVVLPDSPEGEQTAIGWSLSEALKREAGKRLGAVILLSDGSQRALAPRDEIPGNVAKRLKQQGVSIHTVIFGDETSQGTRRDVVLQTLQANQAVHVKNRLAIDGDAVLYGFDSMKIAANVQWETKPGVLQTVETTQVQTGPAGRAVPFKTGYAPQVPGLYKLRLRLAEQPGELDGDNNYQDTIVRVLKGGLKVLYLEGGPRLESRGLRRSLGSAPNIEVEYLRLPAPTAVGADLAPRDPAVRQAMAEAFQPGKYDVYMIGNLPASAFLTGEKPEDAELYKLRERVRAGAGLIMLGGMFSFGPGDYAETPLANILPVQMSPNDRQNPGEPLRKDLHLLGPVQLRPSARAKGNYLIRLTTPERNPAAWAELPPLLNGANKLEPGDPSKTSILLEDEHGNPMLIAAEPAGRVLAFAGDSTWRWVSHGKEEQHKRFWRQLVIWLGRKDQEEGGRVWVNAKQRNVFVGQRVELAAGARTPDLQPLAEFEMRAVLIRRDDRFKELSRTQFKFNRQGELRTRSYQPTEPGDYTIEVRAFQNGKLLGTATERFLVRAAKQLEMQRPVPDAKAMTELATQTGGLAVSPDKFTHVLARLAEIPAQLTEKTQTVSSLWDPLRAGPFAFLGLPLSLAALFGFAVAALLGVEWYLRKRWGLV